MPNLVNVLLFLYQLNAILFLTGILCITIKSTARKFLIYAYMSALVTNILEKLDPPNAGQEV